MSEVPDTQLREPGCLCQWETGDSYCPVHSPEPCGCDEALALRARVHELELLREAGEVELLRRIHNQAESLKCPRLEDVVEIQRLKGELARTRFVSVLRGKCADGWSAMLEKTEAEIGRVKAELAEANNRWHSACDVGRRLEVRNDQLLTELEEAHTLQPLQICTPAERKVLQLAEEWLRSWEDNEAVPDEGLPEERALYHAVCAVRGARVDAELARLRCPECGMKAPPGEDSPQLHHIGCGLVGKLARRETP